MKADLTTIKASKKLAQDLKILAAMQYKTQYGLIDELIKREKARFEKKKVK